MKFRDQKDFLTDQYRRVIGQRAVNQESKDSFVTAKPEMHDKIDVHLYNLSVTTLQRIPQVLMQALKLKGFIFEVLHES